MQLPWAQILLVLAILQTIICFLCGNISHAIHSVINKISAGNANGLEWHVLAYILSVGSLPKNIWGVVASVH